MADGPLMPPNRRGVTKPGDPSPQGTPTPARPQPVAPQPVSQQPAPQNLPETQAFPTAQVVQPAVPVARPAVPVARPAAPPQPAYVPVAQIPVAQIPVAQIPVAQAPYVAPVAATSAAAHIPIGQLLHEPQPTVAATGDYSDTLWEAQRLILGMRVWVLVTAWVGALSALAALARGLFILYVTGGRLTAVLIGACLVMMLSASVGLIVSFQLFGYAGRMRDFLREPSRYWLESTLAAERSMWRTMGVLIILLVFMGVALTVALIAGVMVFELSR